MRPQVNCPLHCMRLLLSPPNRDDEGTHGACRPFRAGAQNSVTMGCVVNQALQAFCVQNAYMALLDFHGAVFHKL